MENVSEDHGGRPYVGIIAIVTQSHCFNVKEFAGENIEVLSISLFEHNDSLIQVLSNVYIPLFSNSHENTLSHS